MGYRFARSFFELKNFRLGICLFVYLLAVTLPIMAVVRPSQARFLASWPASSLLVRWYSPSVSLVEYEISTRRNKTHKVSRMLLLLCPIIGHTAIIAAVLATLVLLPLSHRLLPLVCVSRRALTRANVSRLLFQWLAFLSIAYTAQSSCGGPRQSRTKLATCRFITHHHL